MANREIERVLLLLQKRFNELSDMQDVVTAEEVRNVFQGQAETQDTIMKLYAEHNSDYALRVGGEQGGKHVLPVPEHLPDTR